MTRWAARVFVRVWLCGLLLLVGAPIAAAAQTSTPSQGEGGQVLFSRGSADTAASSSAAVAPELLGKNDPLRVSDTERTALSFTAYDLDVHLTPAGSSLSVRAGLTISNDGATALGRAVLQISSPLRWEAISLSGRTLPVASRLIETDADHTGAMNEAVVTLPEPLAPGGTLNLVALYSGSIPASAERLQRAGAPAAQAQAADWDAIAADGTFLRGFGYVLWYPVSAPAAFFREGDRLFQLVGAMRLRGSTTRVRLRLAVEYQGEPPDAVFFSGRREALRAISDNSSAPAAESPGIATAEFSSQPLGFRALNLFVTPRPPIGAGTVSNPELISAVTANEPALAAYSNAAGEVGPLLASWFGPHPQSSLYLLDHPGQPFEDETLLVRAVAGDSSGAVAEALAHSLTHAWIRSAHPWIDEGLAEFARLLWLERSRGHEAAVAFLQQASRTLAEAEKAPHGADSPAQSSSSSSVESATAPAGALGSSLVQADRELLYRTKAAAVWWMLRGIVGDQALQQALQAYRSDPRADLDPQGFERTLESASHKDLRWFFNDWVYQDRALPRVSISGVTPSQLKGRTGLPDGWLVAVEVRNDGEAVADVPVTVHSQSAAQTTRLRIPGHASASTRIVFAGTPEQVVVNDGSVPEAGPTTHTRELVLPAR